MSPSELADLLERIADSDHDEWFSPGCSQCMYYRTHHTPDECGECEWRDGVEAWLM